MKPYTNRGGASSRPALRVHLTSLGCAKNLVDSERILGRLAAAGAVVNAPPEEADVILVNTCGFIQPAKEESVETILRLARFKRTGRCRALLVMGCLAQRYAAALRKEIPEADGVFGLAEQDAILAACGLRAHAGAHAGRFLLTPKHTAYLRIADGCDNRCAYCAIPQIRGPFRSRPASELLAEARGLVARGARELNLIGQDTTLYGKDLPGAPRIHELLERLSRIPKLRWLRLLYTHPAHFSDALIEAYARTQRLVPYVDLPLQHLNDAILQRMGRSVTQAEALRLIERLRERVPGVAIRTSLITGFPGETRAQFKEMLGLARRLRFEYLGVFAYSREEGTRAARMRAQVSRRTAEGRRREIMAAQQEIAFARNRTLVGSAALALIDAPRPDGSWIARTAVQAPDVDSVTIVTGAGLRAGRFVKVRISGWKEYDLLAERDERTEIPDL
jgi:ribosomal protein S12 methylthiotransferase